MKKILATTCFFLFVAKTFAQLNKGLPLNFQSYAIKLDVFKGEGCALTTKAGEFAISPSLNSEWLENNPRKTFISGCTLERATFFNKDTGFVSGFISAQSGKYNVIYRTANGGQDWTAVNFGQNGWVDDASKLSNGEAWLSVSGSGIAYTKDFGATWTRFEFPTTKQRFTNIFFNEQKQGIIGSVWNALAVTDDNCENWKTLPTPLDQKKYSKTNTNQRPEFNKVGIYKDYYIVCQEDMVFYSRKDTINWIFLPDYVDFYTDPENSGLFFKTNKGEYIKSNDELKVAASLQRQPGSHYDARCFNGSLFFFINNKIGKWQGIQPVFYAEIKSQNPVIELPYAIGYALNGKAYGIKNDKIFSAKSTIDSVWEYAFDAPFPKDNGIYSIQDEQLLYQKGDSIFYFSLTGKPMGKTTRDEMIKKFCDAGITSIVFRKGSHGCFHMYSDELTYTLRDEVYQQDVEASSGTKHSELLPANDAIIDSAVVGAFSCKINLLFNPENNASINDLAFTEKEYQQCKNDIIEFQKGIENPKKKKDTRSGAENTGFSFAKNNIDFSRLLHLVDSVKMIASPTLNDILQTPRGWSTTTDWSEITLINSKGQMLTIQHDSYFPNAFYLPWRVSLNGYITYSTCIEINNFINKVYPGFLVKGNRVEVLHTIVKGIY
jgi:hypothetical protein